MREPGYLESAEKHWESVKAEGLKSVTEATLSVISKSEKGRTLLRKIAGTSEIEDDRLRVMVADIELPNPVIVGAGWDKKGRAVAGLEALGFGSVEVGTVLMYPQAGNDKPRLWTTETPEGRVSLNRLGFNSPGMEEVGYNLDRNDDYGIPLGISIGKNKLATVEEAPQQHARIAEYLYGYADYFVLGVSSPNTPGLRGLQGIEPLTEIVLAVKEAMEREGGQKPLFVKIAPELTLAELDDVISIAVENGMAGREATNTTTNEEIKKKYGWAGEPGGVAGSDQAYRVQSTEVVRYVSESSDGKYDVIGIGGVNSANAALEKIAAGASAVQVVTAIREKGLHTATEIAGGILAYMERNGLKSLDEIRGRNEY